MKQITTFLWFDNNAEEAVDFYLSVFKNSKKGKVTYYDDAAAKATNRLAGSVMTAVFYIGDQEFVTLNGGPVFKFNESISFVVNCTSQEEVDYYWEKLTDGGEPGRCGWLKDKFGLSWQVVPTVLSELLAGKDADKAKRVMGAMMQMDKMDIKALEEA